MSNQTVTLSLSQEDAKLLMKVINESDHEVNVATLESLESMSIILAMQIEGHELHEKEEA